MVEKWCYVNAPVRFRCQADAAILGARYDEVYTIKIVVLCPLGDAVYLDLEGIGDAHKLTDVLAGKVQPDDDGLDLTVELSTPDP